MSLRPVSYYQSRIRKHTIDIRFFDKQLESEPDDENYKMDRDTLYFGLHYLCTQVLFRENSLSKIVDAYYDELKLDSSTKPELIEFLNELVTEYDESMEDDVLVNDTLAKFTKHCHPDEKVYNDFKASLEYLVAMCNDHTSEMRVAESVKAMNIVYLYGIRRRAIEYCLAAQGLGLEVLNGLVIRIYRKLYPEEFK